MPPLSNTTPVIGARTRLSNVNAPVGTFERDTSAAKATLPLPLRPKVHAAFGGIAT